MGGQAGSPADTHQFGDVQVSTGRQSAYITIELILYLLASIGIFLTAAVIDEAGTAEEFGASEAWFYVTLLTVGFLLSRASRNSVGATILAFSKSRRV